MSRWFIAGVITFPVLALRLIAADPIAKPKTQSASRGYVCYRTEKPPIIDGDINDDAWKNAPWSEDFVDIEGDAKPKPRFRTRMQMLWDDEALYIAAELEEPDVWATLKEHDSVIFQDHDFEVFLDPDGDNHLYGELELNALNTTWDLLLPKPYKDGGRALNGWEIIGLKTAVKINGTINNPTDKDKGWTLEICWPWKGVKELTAKNCPPKDGNQYRINFSRVQWDTEVVAGKTTKVKGKPEYNWVWSPQGVIDMHRPERWGFVQFSTQTKPTVAYKTDPSLAVRDHLHEVYYAQRAYHKKHGKYAGSIKDLGIPPSPLGEPKIETTRSGFESLLESGGKKWTIREDSRIWME